MTTEKKDLKNLSDEELFDYLAENLKQSKKKNPVKRLIRAVQRKEKAN